MTDLLLQALVVSKSTLFLHLSLFSIIVYLQNMTIYQVLLPSTM